MNPGPGSTSFHLILENNIGWDPSSQLRKPRISVESPLQTLRYVQDLPLIRVGPVTTTTR